jgi:hypothetical protein
MQSAFMAGIRDRIVQALPWIEPVLDYFDWRKRIIALAAGVGLAVWSFVKDLAWPVIVVLAAAAVVIVAYALVFPAFIRLINVGVRLRPNHAIWKHKKEFSLIQAGFLLADREPVNNPTALDGDAAAWYEVLHEAMRNEEIARIPALSDNQYTDLRGKFNPQPFTMIRADELKKFCSARNRNPEFLG